MFTLPVKAHSHITSKGIVAFVWYLASFVVCALSIFILVVDQNVIDGLSQFFTVELPRYFQLAGATESPFSSRCSRCSCCPLCQAS